jgi:hypothetical protein
MSIQSAMSWVSQTIDTYNLIQININFTILTAYAFSDTFISQLLQTQLHLNQ